MILVWRITTQCNFACGFCAFDRRLEHARVAVDPAEVARFALLAADYAAGRGERLLVSWLGGEPLLWPPLLDVSRQLATHPAIAISATSNGTRLTDVTVQKVILACFSELTVSIDGPPLVHDRLRGAKDSYQRVRTAIAELVAGRRAAGKQLILRVNVLLMRETLPHFVDLCRALADWGIDEITFNQLGGRDRPEFYPGQRLRPGDVEILSGQIPQLKDELSLRGVKLCSSDTYIDRIRASAAGMSVPVSDCKPGESFLFADEHGHVAPCAFTTGHFGLKTSAFASAADIAALPQHFRSALVAAPARECADCPSTQIFGKFAP